MKASQFCTMIILLLPTIAAHATAQVEAFTKSNSFSNILPIKQLIKDEWQQSPDSSSSHAFTQNEVGLRGYSNNFSLSVSQRYDYFVNTNNDTAQAFYFDRHNMPFDREQQYDIKLKLFHQQSNGIRLGYKFNFEHFSSEVRLGFWRLNETRESHLHGQVSTNISGNISANANLKEFYNTNNFLKRKNSDDWKTEGTGVTVDVHMRWQPRNDLEISIDLTDIYSEFSLDDSGFSEGKIDTDGTFINSIGGVAYVPLFRGIETSSEHQFKLPKTVNIDAVYQHNELAYLTHFTRQGDVNFYYLGMQFKSKHTITRLLLDIKNTAPEIQFHNRWLTAYFSIDDTDVDQAMLMKLGINIHLNF